MRRLRLEGRVWIASLVLFVYSMLAVFPSLVFPKLWVWQNQLVDWADDWAVEPLYEHRHRERPG